MSTPESQEKAKPFRLVKYFTVASLIVIFIGTIVLSLLNVHRVRGILREKSEDYAQALVENLNHQVFTQFILPVALKYGRIQLRDEEQQEHLDRVVKSTLHSFEVQMVNIYDMDKTISYSFDENLVGRKDLTGQGYFDAIKGKSSSKLVQKGNWFEILFGLTQENKIITFAPIRAEKPLSSLSGPVLGVVEIVQDPSEDYAAISRFQVFVITTSAVVMGLLLLVLILFVRRGENIIEQRAQEQMKLKEELSRSKHLSNLGEMVAGVSHEIRNPLGIIRSSAELLKKKVQELDPQITIPDIIVEEANRLNSIITDFLNFAKPTNPDFAPCRIEDIITKNLNYLSTQIDKTQYRIVPELDNQELEIMADANMLYQAFLNILINAMQAMPEGGTINVETDFNGRMVFIRFKDSGQGIPEDLMEKIWDPFFTTKEKGTGLGLGIVKNIIQSHGGRIHIANRSDGRGAQVELELPRRQDL